MQRIEIPVIDGEHLVAHHFAADAASRKGVSVIVGSAAAAPQSYYRGFCEFLAAKGFDAFSFDFRGIAQSQVKPLRQYHDTGFFAWATHDYPAMIDYVKQALPTQPLHIVGHSVGGWMPGFTRAAHQVDGILGVAALSGHWRLMARPHRYLHALAWYLLTPLSIRLFGYWPGVVGLGRDAPAGLGRDFAWCAKRPSFIFDAPQIDAASNVRRFTGRLHLLQIADDPWGTPESVSHLHEQFVNARHREIEPIRPSDFGVKAIGHLGFFRHEHRQTLWPHALQRLQALLD